MDKQWKVVSVERTYDMRIKAIMAFNRAQRDGKDRDDALDAAFQAMLDEAPQPPSASDERERFEAWAVSATPDVSFERGDDDYVDMTASLLWHGWIARAALAPSPGVDAAEQKPVAFALQRPEDRHLGRLCLAVVTDDEKEAQDYASTCTDVTILPLYAAPSPAASAESDPQFPFYELRFIMRVLGHKGSAPQEDWQTAYGMARAVFERWAKERKEQEEWLAQADRMLTDYVSGFAQSLTRTSHDQESRRAALLAHLKKGAE